MYQEQTIIIGAGPGNYSVDSTNRSTGTCRWALKYICIGLVLIGLGIVFYIIYGVLLVEHGRSFNQENYNTIEHGVQEGVVIVLNCDLNNVATVTIDNLQTDTGQPAPTGIEAMVYIEDTSDLILQTTNTNFNGSAYEKRFQLTSLEKYSYMLAGSRITISVAAAGEIFLYVYDNFTLYELFSQQDEPIPSQYYSMYELSTSAPSITIDITKNGFYFFAIDNPHSSSYTYFYDLTYHYYENDNYNIYCTVSSSSTCELDVNTYYGCLLAYIDEPSDGSNNYYKLRLLFSYFSRPNQGLITGAIVMVIFAVVFMIGGIATCVTTCICICCKKGCC